MGEGRGDPPQGTRSVWMSQTDAFSWHLEADPLLRSTVVAVTTLDRSPDWDHLRRKMEIGSRIIPALRQQVIEPPLGIGTPRWTYVPTFDLSWHLRRVQAPRPGTLDTVLKMARDIGMAAFDRDRPLWEMHLVDGMHDGGAAIIMKVHQAIIDGIGGVQLAMLAFDLTPDAQVPDELPPEPCGETFTPRRLALAALRQEMGNLAGFATTLPRQALELATRMVSDPVGTARDVAEAAVSIARTVAPVSETYSQVMTRRCLGWRYMALDVPLTPLKEAARAAGGKMNDAYVAGILGGLRRYHERHGAVVGDLRITMPMNLRHDGDTEAGNRITLARFPLPAGIADPVARMAAVRERSQQWREAPANAHIQRIGRLLNMLPRETLSPMLKHIDFLASNVGGFPMPVYLGGARVLAQYPFGPTIGAAVNLRLLSYLDSCCIAVTMDAKAIPDPGAFLEDLRDGFEEVLVLGGEHRRVEVKSTLIPTQRPPSQPTQTSV